MKRGAQERARQEQETAEAEEKAEGKVSRRKRRQAGESELACGPIEREAEGFCVEEQAGVRGCGDKPVGAGRIRLLGEESLRRKAHRGGLEAPSEEKRV